MNSRCLFGKRTLFCLIPALITAIFFGPSLLHANEGKNYTNNSSVDTMERIPTVTVRFANPQYDCESMEYCLDVEFLSDTEDEELFGMNVRFFYDDDVLELIDFRDFQGGYTAVDPNPPNVLTSQPGFGYDFFRLGDPGVGVVDFVNGAIELTDLGADPIYLSTTEWTKLFQICFTIESPNPDSLSFCPSVIWDLEADPADGGYLQGDDGVVITVVSDPESAPVTENVDQFNWDYTGDGQSPPYGEPNPTDCINVTCGIEITCPSDITLDCGEDTLPGNTGMATAESPCGGNITISFTDNIVSPECENFGFIYRTWVATDTCGTADTCLQIITQDQRGSVCGNVTNDFGDPIADVTIHLVADINENEEVDAGDTIYASVQTDILTGAYCFDQVPPCAFVLQEVQPDLHGDLEDYDLTPDPDGDDSGDGPDNEIPVLLTACEIDSNNNFVDIVCPDTIPLLPPDTICPGEFVMIVYDDLDFGLLTYSWDFGSGSTPGDGSGLGPHIITYEGTTENQNTGAEVDLTVSKEGCPDTTVTVKIVKVNPLPNATITGDLATGCYFTDRVLHPVAPEIPGADYAWDFGLGAVPQTAVGYGPHTISYTTSGSKTVSLVIHPNEAGAQCPDSSEVTFLVLSCPGNIVGKVQSTTDEPIADVNLKLYADANTDGLADDANVIRSVFTASDGHYSMASLSPGHYVIIQTQPDGWESFDDGDDTPDNDVVPNIDSLDNLIPVTLEPLDVDQLNVFVESATTGTITGSVFVDMDEDQMPDAEEGLSDIVISLYSDDNTDGIADNGTPLATAMTLVDGSFSFFGVPIGHYVIVESNPSGYDSELDNDMSNDGDAVDNTDMQNDTIPVSITNGEVDADNYFIDSETCGLIVINTNDNGTGSLRQAISCAVSGDTIRFHAALAGDTIVINTSTITFEKDLVFYSTSSPRVYLSSQISGFLEIDPGTTVEFVSLNIISGLAGNDGAAFYNEGTLKLKDVNVYRNLSLPPSEFLIYNEESSELFLSGACSVEFD